MSPVLAAAMGAVAGWLGRGLYVRWRYARALRAYAQKLETGASTIIQRAP